MLSLPKRVLSFLRSRKLAVSRLEAVGKHSPSVTTLKRYARALGCDVEIRLVPASHRTGPST